MTRSGEVRVLLVDDHTPLRLGMRALVESMQGAVVSGEAADGTEAVEKYRALRPDVMVLDLRMPKVDGLQVVETVMAFDRSAKILILTMYDGEDDVLRALRSGAKGYLLKSASREEIVEAITTVARGERYLPGAVALTLASAMSTPALTPREREVLELLRLGLPNKEIAEALGVAASTVKAHLEAVLAKLGASNRTEAVALGLTRGLLK